MLIGEFEAAGALAGWKEPARTQAGRHLRNKLKSD